MVSISKLKPGDTVWVITTEKQGNTVLKRKVIRPIRIVEVHELYVIASWNCNTLQKFYEGTVRWNIDSSQGFDELISIVDTPLSSASAPPYNADLNIEPATAGTFSITKGMCGRNGSLINRRNNMDDFTIWFNNRWKDSGLTVNQLATYFKIQREAWDAGFEAGMDEEASLVNEKIMERKWRGLD